jgi:hypothetical protein
VPIGHMGTEIGSPRSVSPHHLTDPRSGTFPPYCGPMRSASLDASSALRASVKRDRPRDCRDCTQNGPAVCPT